VDIGLDAAPTHLSNQFQRPPQLLMPTALQMN
jgi:hypothetical protein